MKANSGLTGIKLTGWHSCLWHEICTVNETLLCLFFPLYDRESFTRGRLNIILKHRDTGSNLILYLAEQAISVLTSLYLSLYVCLSILQYQLCTLCVFVCVSTGHWPGLLQLLLLFKLRCQHRQCRVSGSQTYRERFDDQLWIVICLQHFPLPSLAHS